MFRYRAGKVAQFAVTQGLVSKLLRRAVPPQADRHDHNRDTWGLVDRNEKHSEIGIQK